MFCPFLGGRRGGGGGGAVRLINPVSLSISLRELEERCTFASTNLLIVARMSWWPDTSSRVLGRYFSTLYFDG